MNHTAKLTPELIDELRQRTNPETGRPYTQNEIARLFGVSRQYVSKVKRSQPGWHRTPREIVMEHFPWEVPSEFQGHWVSHMMRDHAEFMATGGRGWPEWKKVELNRFYDKLEREGVVVEFDPDIPPQPGISIGGWAYRRRRKSDGDLIIRVNRHTKLTKEGRRIWRMPPTRPLGRPQ